MRDTMNTNTRAAVLSVPAAILVTYQREKESPMSRLIAGVADTFYERPLYAFSGIIACAVVIALLFMPL